MPRYIINTLRMYEMNMTDFQMDWTVRMDAIRMAWLGLGVSDVLTLAWASGREVFYVI